MLRSDVDVARRATRGRMLWALVHALVGAGSGFVTAREVRSQSVTTVLVEGGGAFPTERTPEQHNAGPVVRMVIEAGARGSRVALRVQGFAMALHAGDFRTAGGYPINPRVDILGLQIGAAFATRDPLGSAAGLYLAVGIDRGTERPPSGACPPDAGCTNLPVPPFTQPSVIAGIFYRLRVSGMQLRLGMDAWTEPVTYSVDTGARSGVNLVMGAGSWLPR